MLFLYLAPLVEVISSDSRTDRVNRMMLACRGNARRLKAGTSAPGLPLTACNSYQG